MLRVISVPRAKSTLADSVQRQNRFVYFFPHKPGVIQES